MPAAPDFPAFWMASSCEYAISIASRIATIASTATPLHPAGSLVCACCSDRVDAAKDRIGADHDAYPPDDRGDGWEHAGSVARRADPAKSSATCPAWMREARSDLPANELLRPHVQRSAEIDSRQVVAHLARTVPADARVAELEATRRTILACLPTEQ